MKRRVLILAGLMPVAGVAHAQDASGSGVVGAATAVPANVSVANRPRPDYAPIGGRIGDFFLYPELDLVPVYNNNLRATNIDQISDVSLQVRPSVRLVSNWSRNSLQLNTFYQREFHAKYSTEDAGQFGADGVGQLYIGPDTQLALTGSAGRMTEPRTDINSSNATRSPIAFTNLTGGATLTQNFAAFQLVGNVNVSKQTFSDAVALDGTPLPQGFRGNNTLDGSIEGRYTLGAGTSIIAHLEAQQIRYDENPFQGFDRNSRSWRAELGVGLALTRLLYGDVRIGYYKQDNKDPRFLDTAGLSFSANLLYSLTPLTSVRLTADRSIEPGGSVVTSGNVRSTVTMSIEHELRRNIILTAYGRYANIDPQSASPLFGSAQEYEGRFGVDYYLNRRFRITSKVTQFMRRSSTFAPLNQTTVTAGVIITL